jgi:hypothetical protein
MFRKLRIAVSVFSGLVTVALCVLWVRSYWIGEAAFRGDSSGGITTVGSNFGRVYFVRSINFPGAPLKWKYESGEAKPHGRWQIEIKGANSIRIIIPYAALVMPVVAGAWLIFSPPSFSLRTMLIATTMVAVVLGLAAWAAG